MDVTVDVLTGTTLLTNTVNGPPPAPVPGPGQANGMGIFTLIGDTDSSEVSDNELLRITFSTAVTVDDILFSKLFTLASGKDTLDEKARYSFDMGTSFTEVTAFLNNAEGRQPFAIGQMGVTTIDFFTQGGDHDYSIVSIDFSVAAEPGLALLLGLGALAEIARRRP